MGGTLPINKWKKEFPVGVGRRLENRFVHDQTILSGDIYMYEHTQYLGPGYRFYGFAADSVAANSYPFKATNAALIVTKRNDNKGRSIRGLGTKSLSTDSS